MNKITTIPEAINYISANLNQRDVFEQLAEEAAELSQAALKYIRAAKMNGNPTPTSEEKAINNVIEEIEDIINVCYILGLQRPEPTESIKFIRWANRIAEAKC